MVRDWLIHVDTVSPYLTLWVMFLQIETSAKQRATENYAHKNKLKKKIGTVSLKIPPADSE